MTEEYKPGVRGGQGAEHGGSSDLKLGVKFGEASRGQL